MGVFKFNRDEIASDHVQTVFQFKPKYSRLKEYDL